MRQPVSAKGDAVDLDAGLAAAVLVGMLVALVREWASPPALMLAALVALVLLGVVEPVAGLAGFASPATLTVAGLFVVARAVQERGGLESWLHRLLGSTEHHDRTVLARLVLPVEVLSAVVANTPIVAALAPMVRDWAERHGRPASSFLMPLSFAAILGGLLTTIGTSTTLVVSGLLQATRGRGFSFLEVAPLGAPVALLGAVLIVLLAPRLLPDRRSPHVQVATHERDYTFRLSVTPGGTLDGTNVAAAGLRNLAGVFLARVDRGSREITPVAPETVLLGGDVLTFVGQVDDVVDLADWKGLEHARETQVSLLSGDRHGLFEAVVGSTSPLAGHDLKALSFRGRYGGAVIAIHRAGERVEGKLGEIQLRPGDALLVLADRAFAQRWRDQHDFAVVVALDDLHQVSARSQVVVLASVLGMVALAATGVATILEAVLAACAVLVGTRTIGFWKARESVDLDIVIIIASAIGIGAAVQSSGLASVLADGIDAVAGATGYLGALLTLVVGTMIMTELITNVAAAALLVPVGVDLAERLGVDPTGFGVAIAIAASASFLTPIGYQTNTIVYGLGGYRFSDYWRLGLPLSTLVVLTTLVVVPRVWG